MNQFFSGAATFPLSRQRGNFFVAALVLASFFAPDLAYAQAAGTLGAMMCFSSVNLIPFAPLFAGITYIAGAAEIGNGLLHLVKHHENNREHPFHRPVAHILTGAVLLAFPSFLRLLINSMFGVDGGGGIDACAAPVGGGGGQDLGQLMINLITNIKGAMVFMLSIISIIIGILLVMRGLFRASKFGTDPRQSSIGVILANIIVGAVLFNVGAGVNNIMATVFGDAAVFGDGAIMAAIAADFGGDVLPFQQAVYAALTFFQLVGYIAFIRGWLILKNAADGQSQTTVAQGLTHIVGGVVAVNIYRFLEAMDATFGTGFL
jgi:hypothetical protein